MITFEEFAEKFPTTEAFEKTFPPGKKITWYDRYKYTIVGYQIDEQFTNKDKYAHLVIMKCWVKHKQRWHYEIVSSFTFYSMLEFMERETKGK